MENDKKQKDVRDELASSGGGRKAQVEDFSYTSYGDNYFDYEDDTAELPALEMSQNSD